MYDTILLSVALQNWDRYSAHALAARDVAAVMARDATNPLHVLSVYEYERRRSSGLGSEMAARHEEDMRQRTDSQMERQLDDYIAPLKEQGIEVKKLLRVGDPNKVIVQAALSAMADLLIIGSHSKRGLFDIALGGTARQVTTHAPCTIVMVSPK